MQYYCIPHTPLTLHSYCTHTRAIQNPYCTHTQHLGLKPCTPVTRESASGVAKFEVGDVSEVMPRLHGPACLHTARTLHRSGHGCFVQSCGHALILHSYPTHTALMLHSYCTHLCTYHTHTELILRPRYLRRDRSAAPIICVYMLGYGYVQYLRWIL